MVNLGEFMQGDYWSPIIGVQLLESSDWSYTNPGTGLQSNDWSPVIGHTEDSGIITQDLS